MNNTHRKHYPAEIFGYPIGYPIENKSQEANQMKEKYQCPFNMNINHVFGNIDNILLFAEVRLKRIDTFDFVLVKHKPISDEIEDFCVIEFQTDSKIIWAVQRYVYKNMSNLKRGTAHAYNTA